MTNPEIGVWLSENGEIGTPDPYNRYRYCGNDPVNYVDPSGLAAIAPPELTGKDFGLPAKDRDALFNNVAQAKRPMTLKEISLTLRYLTNEIEAGRTPKSSDAVQALLWKVNTSIISIAQDDLKREASLREVLAGLSPQLRFGMGVTQAAAAALTKQLGDDDFAVRENASKSLSPLTPLAADYLVKALNSGDPEAARRSSELLEPLIRLVRVAILRRAVEALPADEQQDLISDLVDPQYKQIIPVELSEWAREILRGQKAGVK